jgi:hypothetical protein
MARALSLWLGLSALAVASGITDAAVCPAAAPAPTPAARALAERGAPDAAAGVAPCAAGALACHCARLGGEWARRPQAIRPVCRFAWPHGGASQGGAARRRAVSSAARHPQQRSQRTRRPRAGLRRRLDVFLPPGYGAPAARPPLWISLHGLHSRVWFPNGYPPGARAPPPPPQRAGAASERGAGARGAAACVLTQANSCGTRLFTPSRPSPPPQACGWTTT